jgi:hypothetical protein
LLTDDDNDGIVDNVICPICLDTYKCARITKCVHNCIALTIATNDVRVNLSIINTKEGIIALEKIQEEVPVVAVNNQENNNNNITNSNNMNNTLEMSGTSLQTRTMNNTTTAEHYTPLSNRRLTQMKQHQQQSSTSVMRLVRSNSYTNKNTSTQSPSSSSSNGNSTRHLNSDNSSRCITSNNTDRKWNSSRRLLHWNDKSTKQITPQLLHYQQQMKNGVISL